MAIRSQIVVAGLAALVAGGIAIAQPGPTGGVAGGFQRSEAFGPPPVQPLGSHWTNPELWDGYDDPGRPIGREISPLPSGLQTRMVQQVNDGLKIAVPQMRLACAADQQKLCADKKTNLAADRCLEYYRLKVSRPCRDAWDKLALAAEGRL
ncbi:hypothetical protein [Phenylobacterium sp.]|uniref:hypothetical protein n=1 Tax=Phenylobacterium sp. TaxID=1871053 RepID=UPI002CE3227A|nr:hypothetical protein [Phenylobacterium sp.]HLZ77653.1 hypothetical protein [Phenylobacterium sp.]